MSINLRRLLSERDKPRMSSGKYPSLFEVGVLRSGSCDLSVRKAQAARVHISDICVLSSHSGNRQAIKTTEIGGYVLAGTDLHEAGSQYCSFLI
jgi:hypothetical protein